MIYSCYSRGKDLITHERQSEVAGELLDIGLMNEYGISRDEVIRNAYGKPSLRDNRNVHIGIAHCTHAVTVIISENRVGIDIEKVRKFDPHAAKRILNKDELKTLYDSSDMDETFFRYWTLKESYIKALGCGFSYPVKKLHISINTENIVSSTPYAVFHLMEGNNGYISSVCHLRESEKRKEDLREIRITIP